jgi:hypothetical protein
MESERQVIVDEGGDDSDVQSVSHHLIVLDGDESSEDQMVLEYVYINDKKVLVENNILLNIFFEKVT